MEPYDLNLQHITYTEEQSKDGNLDSFNNVISYDSSLLDERTGTKPNTQQISDSSHFAWHTTHSLAQHNNERFLPSPFGGTFSQSAPIATVAKTTTVKSDLAFEINQMIKDVYSEIDIPFTPLQDRKDLSDWIAVSSHSEDLNINKRPEHIVAQPSQVKVTHVYNQSVWSDILSSKTTPATKITQLTGPVNTTVVTDCDIKTLIQISANASAARSHLTSTTSSSRSRMAENMTPTDFNSAEPFESVAEALHLQQSVIGNSKLTPAPPDVVAQVIANAERKLRSENNLTHNKAPQESKDNATTASSDLPSLSPVPSVPDPAITRELIRIHSADITRTSGRAPWFGTAPPEPQAIPQAIPQSTGNPAVASGSYQPSQPNLIYQNDGKTVLPQAVNQIPNPSQNTMQTWTADQNHTPSIPDDAQSVASTSSELESLNDNATESFLKSLPTFKAVTLSDILPDSQPKHLADMRYSPPVKETSFRPVAHKNASSPDQPPVYQSFVTDSGVFSPRSDTVMSPEASSGISQKSSSRFVIPKLGPLFQSTPRQPVSKNIDSLLQSNFSGSTSTGSSAQVEEVRREKAKLEGQLEMLTIEAQATLQERAELQAQVASLKLRFMSQRANKTDSEKDVYKADIDSLKQLRVSLEGSVADLQRELEDKVDEGKSLQEELSQSQDSCDKLNLKLKELRDEMKSKEMTIQALKGKVAELYVEVQVSMQAKMESDNVARSSKSDLISLQSTKDWYQQQLELATKARSELQRELTILQAQAMSQTSIVERLKTDNTKLRQQFTDIQNKALKEKEMLAKHLEVIESDMMDREAAFQEIQRERSFIEETFNTKIQTAEDEKSRITLLMQMTTDLENRLDKTHGDLKKKQRQIVQLENENIDLMKKMSLSYETVTEKETVIEDLKQSLIEVESRLEAFQNSTVDKDSEIFLLKEEKVKTEIALKAALIEKSSVDKVLDGLKGDMGKVASSFKLMRQELNTKSTEMTQIQSKSMSSEEDIENLKKELENEKRSYDIAKQDFENRSDQISELQTHKITLESEVLILKEKLTSKENAHEVAVKEKQFLDSELTATREKLNEVKDKLQMEFEEERQQKSSVVDNEEYILVQNECVQLQTKLTQHEKDSKKDVLKQKARSAKLSQDLNAVKTELMERQATFDSNIKVLSEKLRELSAEKDKMETELSMVHRKYELSMLEQKDQIGSELQTLASELQQVQLDKQYIETQFVELQHARDSDLQQYQQQLSSLDNDLQGALQAQQASNVTTETNQGLMMDLEKEKGRLAGVQQSNLTLKQHVAQLEEVLAGRESALLDLQAQTQQALRQHESQEQDSLRRIQGLEKDLKKEKDGQRDTRKQIGQKITENKKLRRQNDSLKQEQEQFNQELENRSEQATLLQTELDTNKQTLLNQQTEMQSMESGNKGLQRELDRVQQQLHDNLAREPVLQEQIKSLQWQLELKCSELAASQDQLKLTEDRQATEVQNLKQLIQAKANEIEHVKMDVSSMKQDRLVQQTKMTQLRSALKSSVHHHKLTQKLRRVHSPGGSGDAGQLELPPLPFDLEDIDKLLQDTTVKALDSKPLDNLQNCLHNLRSEISGLQSQMDVHTNTIETSTHTWATLEDQVREIQHVVQTISNTTMTTATTNSLAAAAVDKASSIIDI